jgi:S-adenosylmethionine/arginine decarboxylase-like enzyme
VINTRLEKDEPFGWSARIDLYDCAKEKLRCSEHIQQFVNTLCDAVLGMMRHGDTLIERFGFHDTKAVGFSFVQLIETSSIVGHVSEDRNAMYLDIFSCRPFNTDRAVKYAVAHFQANRAATETTVRP